MRLILFVSYIIKMSKFILQPSVRIFIQTLQNSKTAGSTRNFTTTNILNAEPPKKRKRIDPAMLKNRVERKIKKCEREIAKLEAAPKQLIPILEYEMNNKEIRELQARPGRSYEEAGTSEAEIKAATRLWSIYSSEQSRMIHRSIANVEAAQSNALDALKELDEELYKKTVALDDTCLIPHISSHMKKETPANPDYRSPDGYIKDVTKDWVM